MADEWSTFEKFCGNSPFWNESLLLDDTYPHFTPCFRQVALIWIPCLALIAVSPFYVAYLLQHNRWSSLPLGVLHIIKVLSSLALLGISVAILIIRGVDENQDDVMDVEYVSEGLKAGCFLLSLRLLSLFILALERRKGFMTSSVLWTYWTVMLLVSIVPFYSNIIEELETTDNVSFVLFYVYFGFLALQFVTSSFVEKRSGVYQDLSKNPSPELTASFPSIISYWWLNGLIIRGYRKTLTEDDIYDLAPQDTCDAVIPPFEHAWAAERARVDAYNNKIRPKVEAMLGKMGKDQHYTEKTPLITSKAKANGTPTTPDPKGKAEKKPKSPFKEPSLLRVLIKVYGPILLLAQVVKTATDLMPFATPKITEALLSYVAMKDVEREWKGYVLACSYFVVQFLVSLGSNQALLVLRRLGMRVKAALISAIYKKSLTITNINDETTAGEIVNLMSVDCQKIEDVCNYLYFIVSTPFQLALSIYMLYDQLGVAVFAGLGVMCLAVPVNAFIGYFLRTYQLQQMKLKDKRMKLMTEILSGIKVLKLYAWEGSFEKKVEEIRRQELTIIRRFAVVIAMLIFVFNTMPYMVQLTSFGVYIAISDEGYLSPSKAFVSLQLFNMLNVPLTFLPMIIPMLVQAGVAITRLARYLNTDDIKPDVVTRDPRSEFAVKITNGEFTWDKEQETPTLRNITMEVKPGSLVAVVGTVGCGKSSLLTAILGEMEKLSGNVTVKDSIAYVPQEAWIQNATLRNNILFGSEYNRRRYDKVVDACALKADLDLLPGGDMTEIGEKGINISGGQKQRVSLARAVYSNNAIYLLDDPLSAVDSHVGKHIFQEVIGPKGFLRDKTRILVTHGIQWLPFVDSIIVMTNGVISEQGTYEELMSRDGAFAQFLKEYIQQDKNTDTDTDTDSEIEAIKRSVLQRVESITGHVIDGVSSADDREKSLSGLSGSARHKQRPRPKRQSSKLESRRRRDNSFMESATHLLGDMESSLTLHKSGASSAAAIAGERLIEDETGAAGKVKFAIYLHYFRAIGLPLFLTSILTYTMYSAASVFSGIWLSMWTDDDLLLNTSRSGEQEYEDRGNLYLGVYAASGIGQGILILIFALISAFKMTDAAGKLHQLMLENVMRSPMSFFDTTPGGRIVNRFSRDVEVIDNSLPATMKQSLNCLGRVLTTIVTISYGTPIFLSVMVPLAIIYILIQVTYIPTSRQLRRIDSITRSPIYTHFSETLSGAASIRGYGVQERFVQESKHRVDHNFKFYFAGIAANTWLGFRLQFLGNLVVLAAAIFAVASTDIDTGIVGLSVSYATQMTSAFEFLVTLMSEVETNIVSVERVKEYTETTREADWVKPDARPPQDWPPSGHLKFEQYMTRYRPGLELVLKDVTCTIKGGEKVGIVGRTGAGKSSMTVALFRIIEAAGGKIIIDGLDIAKFGLHDLRSKLTILPQEPVIFSGTLRMNLDPFNTHTDAELWTAMEHAYLKTFVEGLPQGLAYECGEGGSNLSVGQRQLVCLARTLLRKTKILILDEATAAVDLETDELIQNTIRSEFKDSTVLTIAHRLNTILDYDRVMVLDQGSIKEFNSPNVLLGDKHTVFYSMAKDAGLV
ncbi:multidrug resistance-associated protein 1-like [Physella acuta]|uniref:multidrug resistance-associated protein 1-like n=1 Tax=Physella acuta TaxID=109671 RepID=UPI0027DD7FEC|nr:multidrug resistance-associated protein 1-like [Physella acuta]